MKHEERDRKGRNSGCMDKIRKTIMIGLTKNGTVAIKAKIPITLVFLAALYKRFIQKCEGQDLKFSVEED